MHFSFWFHPHTTLSILSECSRLHPVCCLPLSSALLCSSPPPSKTDTQTCSSLSINYRPRAVERDRNSNVTLSLHFYGAPSWHRSCYYWPGATHPLYKGWCQKMSWTHLNTEKITLILTLLQRVNGVLKREDYLHIYENNHHESWVQLGAPTGQWPKHTSEVVKEWINQAELRFWTAFPKFRHKPHQNMWTVLKKQVCSRKPTHLGELHQFCQEEWLNIHPEDDQKLVDGNQKHLTDVKMAKRLLTKY